MYEELRAKYNPEGSPTRIFQMKLLKSLCSFDKFCRENGIIYSLAGGNLIGAVRHKGFIPWDDDADIILDRTNFNKLLSCVSENKMLCDGLFLKWFTRPVIWKDNVNFIDVFIFDASPDNFLLRKVKQYAVQFINCMIKAKERTKLSSLGQFKPWFIFIPIVLPFSSESLHNCCARISQWFNSNSKYLSVYNDVVKAIPQRYDSNIINGTHYVEFENTELPIWNDYDSFLKVHFGDYMSLPKNIKIAGRVAKQ